jgi:hypothetical protein
VELEEVPNVLVSATDGVWFVSEDGHAVGSISASGVHTFGVGGRPTGLTVTEDAVYVVNTDGTVTSISRSSGRPVAIVEAATHALYASIVATQGEVWVTFSDYLASGIE